MNKNITESLIKSESSLQSWSVMLGRGVSANSEEGSNLVHNYNQFERDVWDDADKQSWTSHGHGR